MCMYTIYPRNLWEIINYGNLLKKDDVIDTKNNIKEFCPYIRV